VIGARPLLRHAEVQEVRAVDGVPVAILERDLNSITVFVRGGYLVTIDGEISLEENLKIVESLLK